MRLRKKKPLSGLFGAGVANHIPLEIDNPKVENRPRSVRPQITGPRGVTRAGDPELAPNNDPPTM